MSAPTYYIEENNEYVNHAAISFHGNAAKNSFVAEQSISDCEIVSQTSWSMVLKKPLNCPIDLDKSGWVYSWRFV